MQLTLTHLLPLLALGRAPQAHALTDADFYGQSPPVYPARRSKTPSYNFDQMYKLTRLFFCHAQPMPKASAAGPRPSAQRRRS